MNLDFCGGSGNARSLAIDSQECVNFYPEIHGEAVGKAKAPIVLIGTPGLKLFANLEPSANFRFTDGVNTWPKEIIFTSSKIINVTDLSNGATSWAYQVFGVLISTGIAELVGTSTDQNFSYDFGWDGSDFYSPFYIVLTINAGVSSMRSDSFSFDIP